MVQWFVVSAKRFRNMQKRSNCFPQFSVIYIVHIFNGDHFLPSGHDVTHITLAMSNAAAYPRASQSIMSLLSKGQLNPGDITILHKLYSGPDPPPVQLLRVNIDYLFDKVLHCCTILISVIMIYTPICILDCPMRHCCHSQSINL